MNISYQMSNPPIVRQILPMTNALIISMSITIYLRQTNCIGTLILRGNLGAPYFTVNNQNHQQIVQ